MPAASSTPCSPTANGNTRCANWPSDARRARVGRDFVGDRVRDRALQLLAAPSRSRRSRAPRTACARAAPARSPSTIAASRPPPAPGAPRAARPAPRRPRRRRCRRWSRRARSCASSRARRTRGRAPAAQPCPTVPPAIRARRRRGARRSRSARLSLEPGRCAITVGERALAVDRLRSRSGGCAPRSPRRPCRRALAASPRCGRASALVAGASRTAVGVLRARARRVRRTRCAPSKASGASVEFSGPRAGRARTRRSRARAGTARRPHGRDAR